ncbi:cupin domain-containing protein [Virgibacillus dokdonensis]|nr:cupin domain-containing protein [Virgibacillus dokdonensis]
MTTYKNGRKEAIKMKIYRFSTAYAKQVTAHESKNLSITPLLKLDKASIQMSYLYLEAGGVVGEHAASTDQLLFVVEGSGEVKGAEGYFLPVQKGEAVYWEQNERHVTQSEHGLTAIVVEAAILNLSHDICAEMIERNERY